MPTTPSSTPPFKFSWLMIFIFFFFAPKAFLCSNFLVSFQHRVHECMCYTFNVIQTLMLLDYYQLLYGNGVGVVMLVLVLQRSQNSWCWKGFLFSYFLWFSTVFATTLKRKIYCKTNLKGRVCASICVKKVACHSHKTTMPLSHIGT